MMKKKVLFGLAGAALLAVGCTNDETLEVSSTKEISFADAFVNNATKTTTDDLTSFDVYGYVTKDNTSSQIFSGDEVSKSGTDWTYTNTQYWIAGGNYVFAAVAPHEQKGVEVSVANSTTTTTIKDFVSDGDIDLIYATQTATGLASGNKKVALTFNHLLSKVKFTFENGFPTNSNISLKVTGVKINNAYSKGKVVSTTSTTTSSTVWTPSSVTGDKALVLNFGDVASNLVPAQPKSTANEEEAEEETTSVVVSSAAAANEKLIIPTDKNVTYEVEFNVALLQGSSDLKINDYNVKATISGVDFTPGYAYNFTAKLTEKNVNPAATIEPIEFTVTEVVGWVNASDLTLSIPEKTTTTTTTGSGN